MLTVSNSSPLYTLGISLVQVVHILGYTLCSLTYFSEALVLPEPPAIGHPSWAPCNWAIGHQTAAPNTGEEVVREAGCGRYYRWMPPHY